MLYNNLTKLVKTGVEFLSSEEIKNDYAIEKLQFLIEKGLSNEEILQALEIYNLKQNNMADVICDVDDDYLNILRDVMHVEDHKNTKKQEAEQLYALPPLPPPVPAKDWKDVFIMAAASSGVAYGMYHLMHEFILPKIMPKSDNEVEKDKNEVQQNIEKIDNKLEEIDCKYNDSSQKEAGKYKKLEEIIVKLTRKIDDLEEEKHKVRQDFKLLQSDIKTLSKNFNKFISNNDNSKFLTQMEKEIKSLNSILEFKLDSQKTNFDKKENGDSSSTIPKKNSINFNDLTRPPLFDNSLAINQIPTASDILSKMNLKPLSNGHIESDDDNDAAIRNEIENISMDHS
ncbi:hypothetical protein HANVADRAFT_52886 [Hanseniaspora valbyensis NRRL Y-1626]|uniref:Peroxisomal membrane protein PEX14 n=1 Tax=Hanseniaspora valbyensis NRRL Y-1626 TaxID=766949 RepID=A0A1B7TDT1_9ASCO|nr:hypothetical protein HANVADRAFT_52886 [Hanseniaspora valbyensis NRRL Y-1626]